MAAEGDGPVGKKPVRKLFGGAGYAHGEGAAGLRATALDWRVEREKGPRKGDVEGVAGGRHCATVEDGRLVGGGGGGGGGVEVVDGERNGLRWVVERRERPAL